MADKGQRTQTAKNKPPSGDRVAKAMARAGLCSRRDAEAWIVAGRVRVNGVVIKSPALNVTPADHIVVDGEPLPQRERTRLFLYHKPRGLVTTHADPEGRPTIFEGLPKTLPRLLSVGRLDMTTEGLLLLTNDGGLARILELPKTGWLRRYRVRAHGRVAPETLKGLRDGITIDGIHYGAIDAEIEREQGANLWLTFAMREGKNREVKNVMSHLGLAVNRLIRVSFGPFQLGQLEPGAVEEVRTRHLREQLGERVAAAAGSLTFDPAGCPALDEAMGRALLNLLMASLPTRAIRSRMSWSFMFGVRGISGGSRTATRTSPTATSRLIRKTAECGPCNRERKPC